MKPSELRKKSKQELEKILNERRERVKVLRFDSILDKVKDVKEMEGAKKDIARILTILKEQSFKS
jgi:ribosomal protein L29